MASSAIENPWMEMVWFAGVTIILHAAVVTFWSTLFAAFEKYGIYSDARIQKSPVSLLSFATTFTVSAGKRLRNVSFYYLANYLFPPRVVEVHPNGSRPSFCAAAARATGVLLRAENKSEVRRPSSFMVGTDSEWQKSNSWC